MKTNETGDAREQFMALVDEQVAAGKSKADAVRAVVKKHPQLQQRLLDEANDRS